MLTCCAAPERRQLGWVVLLGTRGFMQSRSLGGVLDDVAVIAPVDDLLEVHEACTAMARTGVAQTEHRDIFLRAVQALIHPAL